MSLIGRKWLWPKSSVFVGFRPCPLNDTRLLVEMQKLQRSFVGPSTKDLGQIQIEEKPVGLAIWRRPLTGSAGILISLTYQLYTCQLRGMDTCWDQCKMTLAFRSRVCTSYSVNATSLRWTDGMLIWNEVEGIWTTLRATTGKQVGGSRIQHRVRARHKCQ